MHDRRLFGDGNEYKVHIRCILVYILFRVTLSHELMNGGTFIVTVSFFCFLIEIFMILFNVVFYCKI